MKKLLFLALLAPALASAQIQLGASAGFTIDLPVVIPQLVVVTPGIEVVPGVDYEVFRANGFYWTRHDGRWYRSNNPRSGWVHTRRGVPPGLTRMPPGKYRRWRPPHRAAPVLRGPAGPGRGPGPAYRGDERHGGRHDDHGRDHGRRDRDRDDRGERDHGRGRGKH